MTHEDAYRELRRRLYALDRLNVYGTWGDGDGEVGPAPRGRFVEWNDVLDAMYAVDDAMNAPPNP